MSSTSSWSISAASTRWARSTVLGVVALTVYALLRRFRPAEDSVESPEQQRIQNADDDARPDRKLGDTVSDYLLVPAVIMQWLFPVIITFAAYLFMRGHDLPGGGFRGRHRDGGGLHPAIHGCRNGLGRGQAPRAAGPLDRHRPATAVAVGSGSWVLGYPFLTTHSQYIELPWIGAVPAATALLFDFGVFSLVLGATTLMLIALAHQSIRRLRAPRTTPSASGGGLLMELVLAIGIGVLIGSGVWLLFRPRTYQLIIGLSLIAYGVNLFIFSMGRLKVAAPPVLASGGPVNPADYADPIPQALVLTAIVIGFATAALFLVVLLVSRGLTGSDHVDGREPN
jgi:multicomponent K+:H+ antiporter subunit A